MTSAREHYGGGRAAMQPAPFFTLRGHTAPVHAVRFHQDDSLLSADGAGIVKIWDLRTHRQTLSFHAHDEKGVLAVEALARQPHIIVSQGKDGWIRCWDTRQRVAESNCSKPAAYAHGNNGYDGRSMMSKPVSAIETQSYAFCRMALIDAPHVERPLVASPTAATGVVAVWDLLRAEVTHVVTLAGTAPAAVSASSIEEDSMSKQGMCMSLALFRAQAKQRQGDLILASGSEAGYLAFHSLLEMDVESASSNLPQVQHKPRPLGGPQLVMPEKQPLLCFDLDRATHTRGIAGSAGKELISFDLDWTSSNDTSNPSISVKLKARRYSRRARAAGQANGARASENGAGSGGCDLDLEREGVSQVKLRADGRIWASAGWDYRTRLFSVKTDRALAVLRLHTASVFDIDFYANRTCRLGSTGTARSKASMAANAYPTAGVGVSSTWQHRSDQSRSGWLATASKDGRIALWNLYP